MTSENIKENPEIEEEITGTEEIAEDIVESETSSKEDDAENKEEIISALKEECSKYKDDFIRAHAEMENVRRRSQQEIEKTAKFAVTSFAKDILAVADNLSRAVSSVPEECREQSEQIKSLLTGVEMTQRELLNVFERHSIKKIEILDKTFDPNYHQVVQEVEDKTKPAGTIINELQTGYTIADRILREAMVVVSKGGPKKTDLENPPGSNIDTEA